MAYLFRYVILKFKVFKSESHLPEECFFNSRRKAESKVPKKKSRKNDLISVKKIPGVNKIHGVDQALGMF